MLKTWPREKERESKKERAQEKELAPERPGLGKEKE